MDRALIDRYAAGADAPAQAMGGLTRAELHAAPVANSWSIQHILVHLMDSDLIGTDRMKRIIAEQNPLIIAFDESAFAQRLRYDKLDAQTAAEVFRLNRRLMVDILRDLADEDFERPGIHSQNGRVTLGGLVRGYSDHLEHHLGILREKRRLLGKPL